MLRTWVLIILLAIMVGCTEKNPVQPALPLVPTRGGDLGSIRYTLTPGTASDSIGSFFIYFYGTANNMGHADIWPIGTQADIYTDWYEMLKDSLGEKPYDRFYGNLGYLISPDGGSYLGLSSKTDTLLAGQWRHHFARSKAYTSWPSGLIYYVFRFRFTDNLGRLSKTRVGTTLRGEIKQYTRKNAQS